MADLSIRELQKIFDRNPTYENWVVLNNARRRAGLEIIRQPFVMRTWFLQLATMFDAELDYIIDHETNEEEGLMFVSHRNNRIISGAYFAGVDVLTEELEQQGNQEQRIEIRITPNSLWNPGSRSQITIYNYFVDFHRPVVNKIMESFSVGLLLESQNNEFIETSEIFNFINKNLNDYRTALLDVERHYIASLQNKGGHPKSIVEHIKNWADASFVIFKLGDELQQLKHMLAAIEPTLPYLLRIYQQRLESRFEEKYQFDDVQISINEGRDFPTLAITVQYEDSVNVEQLEKDGEELDDNVYAENYGFAYDVLDNLADMATHTDEKLIKTLKLTQARENNDWEGDDYELQDSTPDGQVFFKLRLIKNLTAKSLRLMAHTVSDI